VSVFAVVSSEGFNGSGKSHAYGGSEPLTSNENQGPVRKPGQRLEEVRAIEKGSPHLSYELDVTHPVHVVERLVCFDCHRTIRARTEHVPEAKRTEEGENILSGLSALDLLNLGLDEVLGGLGGDSPVLPGAGESGTGHVVVQEVEDPVREVWRQGDDEKSQFGWGTESADHWGIDWDG
jgi:hypothetical protein